MSWLSLFRSGSPVTRPVTQENINITPAQAKAALEKGQYGLILLAALELLVTGAVIQPVALTLTALYLEKGAAKACRWLHCNNMADYLIANRSLLTRLSDVLSDVVAEKLERYTMPASRP